MWFYAITKVVSLTPFIFEEIIYPMAVICDIE